MGNPYSTLDVPRLLTRLGIRAKAKLGGKKYEAICPNPAHNDHSPSWFIRNVPGEPFHGCHVCHGCGWRGGPTSLVESVLCVEGSAARDFLLDLSAPPPMPNRIELELVQSSLNKEFKLPPCFKFEDIGDWPIKFRKYALEDRRLHPEQIKRWGIGYVDKCRCKDANGRIGRHKNRIALPVRDETGTPRSYTARSIVSGGLRYVEPHTFENDSNCLYGAENWRGNGTVIVTEGIFDALAVETLINTNISALRGSNPDPLALVKLTRFDIVVALVDPDKAGKKARDAINAACGRHSDVRIIALPETKGKDGKKIDPSKLCETEEGKRYLMNRLKDCLNV